MTGTLPKHRQHVISRADGNLGGILQEHTASGVLAQGQLVLLSTREEVKYLLFACGNLAAQMSLRGVEVLFVDCLHI